MCELLIVRYACILGMLAASTIPAIGDNTNRACRLEVQLVDGSRICGLPKVSALSFHNPFAKFNIDLNRIQTIRFLTDRSGVSMNMQNGDVLTAVADFDEIALNTLFGPVAIKLPQIQVIDFTTSSAPRKGLIAEYLFCGNADDSSGHRGHGIVHGATLAEDRFGNKDQAYAFNGDAQWIEVADSELTNSLNALTVSVWAKPADSSDRIMTLVAKQPSGYCSANPSPTTSNHGGLFDLGIGNKRFHFVSQLESGMTSEGVEDECRDLDEGKWHHIAVTVDNASKTFEFYLDGESVYSSRIKRSFFQIATDEPIRIGTRKDSPWQNSYFNGVMDDILIYDRALTADEIRRLYHAEPATK